MRNLRKMGANSNLIQMDSAYEASMVLPRSVHCVREAIYISCLPTASHFLEDLSQRLARCIALNCQNCGARWDSESNALEHQMRTLLNTPCGMHKLPFMSEKQ